MQNKGSREQLVLLTGATGYVGGHLLKALEAAGKRVRCLARRPDLLRSRTGPETETVRGDVLDRSSLIGAMQGVHTAYYLVHSMDSPESFEQKDREAARNFGEAAREASVPRIIYLGGLGESSGELSPHLRSRHEVGNLLRAGGVQVIEFRASIIIGPGSISFEMVRALAERLPVMITPLWVSVKTQPIAISDVVKYLLAAHDLTISGSPIFEIGGADIVSYGDIIREYARQRGLHRLLIRVPVLTPRLSSLWLGLVTPFYARVGRKLIDSIRHPTVVHDAAAQRLFGIQPGSVRDAIADALRDEDKEFAAIRWSRVLTVAGDSPNRKEFRFGNRIVRSETIRVRVPSASAFAPVRRIGGATGWFYGEWLWQLRGLIDLLAGGVGMRRGRPNPELLEVGDQVDCWRVEAFEPDRHLLLAAEMKFPGRAWLDFEVEGDNGASTIRQTAIFDPLGLLGLAYWYATLPLHRVVFAGMLRGIAAAAART